METKLPAIQVEQVEDDVAPVTAEYVPAKASDAEYAYIDSNTEYVPQLPLSTSYLPSPTS